MPTKSYLGLLVQVEALASANQAERVCAGIRCVLSEIFDEPVAAKMRILYGGSVTGNNAAALFEMPNIDGALVGGASLKMDFENIVKAKPAL